MTTLAIVGVGNIGWRHLQAALTVEQIAEIHCVEPRADQLQARLDALQPSDRSRVVSVNGSLEELRRRTPKVDIVISAVMTDLQQQFFGEYLELNPATVVLEKPVAQSRQQIEHMADVADQHGSGARIFVNCSRNLWTGYRDLRARFSQRPAEQRIVVEVIGQQWGLGCNGIHFLELFRFLTDCTEVNHVHSVLAPTPTENKRGAQYEEYCGYMAFENDRHDSLVLASAAGGNQAQLLLVRDTNSGALLHSADEESDTLIDVGQLKKSSLGRRYVSQSTADVLTRLIADGTSGLPSLREILVPHNAFFESLESVFPRKTFAIT